MWGLWEIPSKGVKTRSPGDGRHCEGEATKQSSFGLSRRWIASLARNDVIRRLDAQTRPRVSSALPAPASDAAGELLVAGRNVDHQGDELVPAIAAFGGETLA